MVARAEDEENRVSTPLELLFDLTFVVAVAQAAVSLEHGMEAGHLASAIVGYLLVFFAIWWAWMNFTWFASAYDTDDVSYRLLVFVQMLGVLVLAAGVPAATERLDYRAVTIGYVVMRAAMVVQWLRARRGDPAHAGTAARYAVGITALQVLWILRLLLAPSSQVAAIGTFVALAAAELAVPYWAEHRAMTTWHPHHITERYGLFTIIVLGECVLGSTVAVQTAVERFGWSPPLLLVGGSSFLLVFALWWLYFLRPAAAGLERRRGLSFLWGYGHYVVFAALAALGAGLNLAVATVSGSAHLAPVAATAAVAVPVAVFVVTAWALHAWLTTTTRADVWLVGAAALGTLALAALPALGVPLSWSIAALAVPAVALVALKTVREGRTVEQW
jgi:low temperature requirement protein LtrA